MTSADSTMRALLIATLLGALGACSSVPKPGEMMDRAATAIGATATAAATAVASAPPIAADTQAQFDRALQAQRSGRSDEALRLWTALAQAHPELGGVHANIGLIHRQAGRNVEAVEIGRAHV